MAQTPVPVVFKNTGDTLTAAELNSIVSTVDGNATDAETRVASLEAAAQSTVDRLFDEIVVVKSAADLSGTLSSNVIYFLDGVIDMGSQTIEVPAGGLSIKGHTFDVSKLVSSQDAYTLFTSPVGGSGNLVARDVAFEISGVGSKVYDLTDATGFSALEILRVNYNNCSSLGTLTNYRQGLESGTGRFGGTPELTLAGTWIGGFRIATSIARGMNNFTSLFKAGAGFNYNGRFITDINCDLPATGALLDFAEANINNKESLILSGAYITRSGVLDSSDPTITPNIDETSIYSSWSDNTGVPDTHKFIESVCTLEVETPIAAIDTYYPLLGTFNVTASSQFDMPANGEFRLLTGNGTYIIQGDLAIDGNPNDVIDVRVTKSTDDGATWPTELNHTRRVVNNLVGNRDVAFFTLSFLSDLKEGDRVRVEVENKTGTSNVTMELDSFVVILGVR